MKAATPHATSADAEIYADLVETLFDTTETLVAGIIAGLLAPMVAWLSTGDPIYLALASLMGAIAAYRIHVLLWHNRSPVADRRRDAEIWERRYAIGAVSFMALLGLSAAILFHQHHNEMIGYYGVIIMTGVTGNLASRNAARPNIVFWQVVGTCLPLALTVLFSFSVWYWGLSAFLILGALSVFKTTKFLHGHLESALRNGLDASRQRQKFSLALNSMTHGLCMGDANLSISVINRRVIDFFGIVAATTPIRLEALAHAIGRSVDMSPVETQVFTERWKRHAAMPHANVFLHKIGERYFDFHCERAEGGAFITVIDDVTAQQRALREIERIAHYDDLTGLPNRYQFQDTLSEDLVQLRQRGLQVALLTVDLDRFKEVNDTLGHTIGDLLLASVGARLNACAPAPNMLARLGGDEFCLLLRPTKELPDVDALANRILSEMHRPFVIEGNALNIGASVGVAIAPRDAETPIDLLKCSDLALYQAKGRARGTAVYYAPEMQEALRRRRELETELRKALSAGELVVFYQPIIDSRDATVVCMEALLRWRHPHRGMVSPGEFIPIAEETGLIVEIGAWILRQACADAMAWPEHIRVAVNLAPRQFQQSDLVDCIAATLRETGLPPDRLELEITETTLMMQTDDIEGKVRRICALGARLSLDDFGTGYSSLGYLDRFPVKKVKIDRAFANQAIDSPKTQAIIGAISLLARDLGIDLVAEGVETNAQLAFMASRNVFLIQGYLYSKPRPVEELAPRLASWADAPSLESAA